MDPGLFPLDATRKQARFEKMKVSQIKSSSFSFSESFLEASGVDAYDSCAAAVDGRGLGRRSTAQIVRRRNEFSPLLFIFKSCFGALFLGAGDLARLAVCGGRGQAGQADCVWRAEDGVLATTGQRCSGESFCSFFLFFNLVT